jgi:hypothetical protein
VNGPGHVLKRSELPLPDGWRVTRGGRVQVLDHERLTPADLPVRGRWVALDRSPDGWWLQPADDTARWWLQQHGSRAGATSGCISVHGQRLVPGHLELGR